MPQYKLFIQSTNPELLNQYTSNLNESNSYDGDSGIDLYTPEEVVFYPGETKMVDLQIRCQMIDKSTNKDVSYYLYPRSSIAKTPLRLANSVGIIDAGYRGNIIAALTYVPSLEILKMVSKGTFEKNLESKNVKFVLSAGTRVVQICSGDLSPIKYEVKKEITQTERGEGGFGSTGGTAV